MDDYAIIRKLKSEGVIRNWLKEELKDFLKEHNYKFASIHGIYGLVQRNELTANISTISQDSSGYLSLRNPLISFKKVEDLIFKITQEEVFAHDSTTVSICTQKISDVIENSSFIINSQEDVKIAAEVFKKNFVELYLPAYEKYSNLENVLALWDSLPTLEWKNAWFNGPEKYIKIIIISKLCHDTRYSSRCEEYLEYYKSLIKNGKDYYQELKWCEEVIDYLSKNEI
ncbi:hypothetical protein [Arcicella lustrica]|uniref:Uncharacterized protein n=1 Tax=Arcicella lustrica TaxID=2984196 RepID=A0ABU5SD62_9BACT|nr:hypothetical protein [Arcicella sp. DC25W]MEA5425216.1 hypothetical protein [Arcicella sp. DC25W]